MIRYNKRSFQPLISDTQKKYRVKSPERKSVRKKSTAIPRKNSKCLTSTTARPEKFISGWPRTSSFPWKRRQPTEVSVRNTKTSRWVGSPTVCLKCLRVTEKWRCPQCRCRRRQPAVNGSSGIRSRLGRILLAGLYGSFSGEEILTGCFVQAFS